MYACMFKSLCTLLIIEKRMKLVTSFFLLIHIFCTYCS
ncbi:hypothetical protein BCE_0476 [Bacillus cereus ATCC 10987]|uniref:Uncharacterized protein n=1 Tax=Bacillus cereus (strain ATCC 10987 / NRS 248) TaxID=222523 RepID=Q73E83_BACC1|nr:hypothetical protein BCE_0476 [Bacillus cereus ATCC 10987]